jgi:predicted PurR-regulated permease PerM
MPRPFERPTGPLSPGRVLTLSTLAIMPVIVLLLLWFAWRALFLLVAGILLAVLLDAAARALAARTPLQRQGAFWVVLAVLGAVFTALGWFGGSTLAAEAGALRDALREQATQVAALIERFGGGREDVDGTDSLVGAMQQISAFLWRDGSPVPFAAGVMGALANAFVVLFVGIFLAASPDLYRRGLVRLFPPCLRRDAGRALAEAGAMLRSWLLGKLASMVLVGVLTYAGLALVGYPLALPLALLAGGLAFVPNIGPVLTYVPIALTGMSEGVGTALTGVAVYAVAQTLESFVITPLIQKRMVSLPPALILMAQVVGGLLFGLWGVALATPITAVLRLWVERFYVRRALEGEGHAPGEDRQAA